MVQVCNIRFNLRKCGKPLKIRVIKIDIFVAQPRIRQAVHILRFFLIYQYTLFPPGEMDMEDIGEINIIMHEDFCILPSEKKMAGFSASRFPNQAIACPPS
jgi:hypothetical protein